MTCKTMLGVAVALGVSAGIAQAMSNAIDACINELRAIGGPDAQGGQVLSTSFSEAGTLVMLRDAGGSTYRCIAYEDGAIGELSVVDAADDGGGALAGNGTTDGGGIVGATDGTTRAQVRFAAGASAADLSGALTPGSTQVYALGAQSDQFLTVTFAGNTGPLEYQIFNPDGSALLDLVAASTPYRGQLWQSGDHLVEIVNRSSADAAFQVAIGIE